MRRVHTGNVFDEFCLQLLSVFASGSTLTILLQGLEVFNGDLPLLAIRVFVSDLLAGIAATSKLSHIFCFYNDYICFI